MTKTQLLYPDGGSIPVSPASCLSRICLTFNFETVSEESPGWPGHPCESASWVGIFNCPVLLSMVFEGGDHVPILCAGSFPQHPSLKEGLKDHGDQDRELPSPPFFWGCVCGGGFKKSMPLMRSSRRPLFYIFRPIPRPRPIIDALLWFNSHFCANQLQRLSINQVFWQGQ